MKSDVRAEKAVLMSFNLLFLLSGVALLVLGVLLLSDTPRVLLSRLLNAEDAPNPLFYYLALGLVAVGLLFAGIGCIGCCGACQENRWVLGLYVALLILLLVAEAGLGVLAGIFPHYIGVGLTNHLVESLQRNFGVPGKEQLTAAVDLAQNKFQCCGIRSPKDYGTSRWRLQELGGRDLAVPLTCCLLANGGERAFLDPQPRNRTLCQSTDPMVYQMARYTEGCMVKVETWFKEQALLFISIGLGVVVLEVIVLASAAVLCSNLPRLTD